MTFQSAAIAATSAPRALPHDASRQIHSLLDEDALWDRYWACEDTPARNALVLFYEPLVDQIVSRLPSSVRTYWEADDLRSFGLLGLIEAISRWAPRAPSATFAAYATQRIRGAVFDELRQLDWLPRTERRRVVEFKAATDALSGTLSRTPERNEILTEMGAGPAERKKVTAALHSSQLLHLEQHVDRDNTGDTVSLLDLLVADRDLEPENRAVDKERLEEVARAMKKLPDRQRTVVSCHFLGGLTQEQIGTMLGVSNSRICQIEASAMQTLRKLLVPAVANQSAPAG